MAVVLVVEDTEELAHLMKRELAPAGYRVLVAADGEEALEVHSREMPDLVLLDWMLPKLDGLEVLRRVRDLSSTPVLMLTVKGEELDRVMGLEVGADDYLTKPFGMRELLARVRALLRREELLRKTLAEDQDSFDGSVGYLSVYSSPSPSDRKFSAPCIFLGDAPSDGAS